jgi:two-component system sensor histidine kinase HydH
MRSLASRIPLATRIGAVLLLFAAASGTLWYTASNVFVREGRRAEAHRILAQACEELVEHGEKILAGNPRWPTLLEPPKEEADAVRLAREARSILGRYYGLQGGFFTTEGDRRFLPEFSARTPQQSPGAKEQASLYDLVETQVDAAIRKRRVISVVEDLGADQSVAVRTAPVRVKGGDVTTAAWVMVRLVDPLFLDQSVRGYRAAAGLSLGGIALSLALTVGLARTVRRQAAERDRLQTELRRSERLAALGKLLAGVAHEVRNPLAGIRSTGQLWQRGIGMDGESVSNLLEEVDRLEAIVSRLLQFSRADAQDLVPGDLNAVVDEAARLALPAARGKGIRVELALDPDLPTAAIAPPALMQVFRNLTTNAIQAMPPGGTLTLTTRRDPAQEAVEVTVADTGPGLSAESLGHLFEPFYTSKPDGTGLGLAIAREIVLAHRGDLHADNRPDRSGAVFTLRLPTSHS